MACAFVSLYNTIISQRLKWLKAHVTNYEDYQH